VNNERKSFLIPFLILASLAAITGGALIYKQFAQPIYNGIAIHPPKAMPGSTLQSANGRMSLESFCGKYVLLYFGYTSCPDVCPIEMATLTTALSILDPKKVADFQVIFVSVDYQRDTPDVSNAFAKKFNPSFIGLSGTEDQINRATKEYGIYYKFNPPDPITGFYIVDHTAVIMVLNRNDELVLIWPFGTQPDQETSDLAMLANR
jgi:protein SCO1/2